jgi:RND family efflux transporter MFP subunit
MEQFQTQPGVHSHPGVQSDLRVLHNALVTIFTVTAALLAALPVLAQSTAVQIETTTAVKEMLPRGRLLDGKVEAVHSATVSSQTSGRIAAVFRDVDDYVPAGSVLVQFTDVEQQSELRQSQAQLREARARLAEAGEEHRRAQNLLERGLGSQRDLDRALAAMETAGARVAGAESAVESAQQKVEYTLVRAPYAGIVTQRHVEVGETVSVGQALMSGISLEQLRIVVDVPQGLAGRIRQAPRAEVLVDPGSVEPHKITLFPVADPVTNTFRVRLDLPPGQFNLYPGMFVKVRFLLDEAERLLVPSAALIERSEVTAVYVVNNQGIRLRQIRTGRRFGERIEVLAGLSAGERVANDPVAAGILAKTGQAESEDG